MKSPFFTEEHQIFRDTVRHFVEKEIVPHLKEWEKEEQIPKKIWRKMGEAFLLGINYPEQFGGKNADIFHAVAFLEELGRHTRGGFSAAVALHQFVVLAYLNNYGNRGLKQHYLLPGIRGEKVGALAISEPHSGGDAAAMNTRAVKRGEYYILNGVKTFVINGHSGDFLIVAAKTAPQTGAGGISLFVVDTAIKGVESRLLKQIGWRCADTAEISFDNVMIPITSLIGQENMGFYYLNEGAILERLVSAVTGVASGQYCLETTLQHLAAREDQQKLSHQFQALRHQLADLASELEATRQLTFHACWLYQEGLPSIKQGTMAKLRATELARQIADACLQYFEGYGYLEDNPIAPMFRDIRAAAIISGPVNAMRDIISKLIIEGADIQGKAIDTPAASSEDAPASGKGREMPPASSKSSPSVRVAEPRESGELSEGELPAESASRRKYPREEEEEMESVPQEEVSAPPESESVEDRTPPAPRKPEPVAAEFSEDSGEEEIEEDFDLENESSQLFSAMEKAFAKEQPHLTDIPEEDSGNDEQAQPAEETPTDTEPGKLDPAPAEEVSREAAAAKNGDTEEPASHVKQPANARPAYGDAEERRENSFRRRPSGDLRREPFPGDRSKRRGAPTTTASPEETLTVAAIIHSLPERFYAERADRTDDAIFHFKITGNGGGDFSVKIQNSECTVQEGLSGRPNCVIETNAKTYIDMETGKSNPQIAFMMGKVKISNVPLMMRFIKMFKKLPEP